MSSAADRSGPATKPRRTSDSNDETDGLLVCRSARYCRNFALDDTGAPGPASARNAVQSLPGASGLDVLPVRTSSAMAVPAGVAAVHAALPQLPTAPPLKMRETKLPAVAYGVMRSQSRVTAAPPTPKSLTSGRI